MSTGAPSKFKEGDGLNDLHLFRYSPQNQSEALQNDEMTSKITGNTEVTYLALVLTGFGSVLLGLGLVSLE